MSKPQGCLENQECEQQLNGALTSLKTAAESLKEAERVVSLGRIPVRCRIPEIVYSKSKDVGGVLCSILQSVSAILLQKSYGHIFRSFLCFEKLLELILLHLDPLTFVNQKSFTCVDRMGCLQETRCRRRLRQTVQELAQRLMAFWLQIQHRPEICVFISNEISWCLMPFLVTLFNPFHMFSYFFIAFSLVSSCLCL